MSVGAETANETSVKRRPEPDATILIVEDDPQLRVLFREALRAQGFQVSEASSGSEALATLQEHEPDLVLLDVLMPDLDGIETCRRIRARSTVPIIMLTALGRDQDIVAGLEAGADDYVTKPVSLVQLLARIRAHLRRRALGAGVAGHPQRVLLGDLVIDPRARQVIVEGRVVNLSPREWDLLRRLAQSPGQVVRQEELLQYVWGTTDPEYLAHLRSFVKLLRQKIEPEPYKPRYICLRSGIGYVLEWE